MDKYEFKLKIDEMRALASSRNYAAAAEIAETINWRKARNLNAMVLAGEIFEQVGRFDESKEILLMAYDKSPIGRNIIYRLAEIAIKMKNYDEAQEYYDEFVDIAPHDNLKYVLKYKMTAAQGLPYQDQIEILEELKEQEYSEEWAYELAYLYHRNGQPEKCVDACDELILWFGDGIYVEKALELKMHYQPLTKLQEQKYREFRQKRTGVIEVKPDDFLESGEIVNQTVKIPSVVTNSGKFNTANLQKELERGMQQIMDATEKEGVSDAMDNIKKLVGEIPYLSLQERDVAQETARQQEEAEHALDDEIDRQLDQSMNRILGEEQRKTTEYQQEDLDEPEPERQMSIEEILAEWEKTKQATQAVLREAEERKLESAKEKALHEAEGLMDRLMDIMPQLTAGVTPKELLEKEYLQGTVFSSDMPDDNQTQDGIAEAGRIVAGMNRLMQQQIDSFHSDEGFSVSSEQQLMEMQPEAMEQPEYEEPLKVGEFVGNTMEPHEAAMSTGQEFASESHILTDPTRELPELPSGLLAAEKEKSREPVPDSRQAEGEEPVPDSRQAEREESVPDSRQAEREEFVPDSRQAEREEFVPDSRRAEREEPVPDSRQAEREEPVPDSRRAEGRETVLESGGAEEEISLRAEAGNEVEEDITEEDITEEDMEEAAKAAGFYPKAPGTGRMQPVPDSRKRLTAEQKQIFSYFMPVAGMEAQIYDLLKGVSAHLQWDRDAKSGNIIVDGINGSGKTFLVTGIIKALQKELNRPKGNIGKIDASALNQKDMDVLAEKIKGGCLIIESAGKITRETAVRLSQCMEQERAGTLYILVDTKMGIQKAIERDSSFAAKFTERISIPLFTNDELVAFGKAYANELDYDIDEMGILALYKRIGSIQKLDHVTTLTEVKEIVDGAIDRAEKGAFKKVIGILTSTRYNEENFVVLREKDFEE